MIIVKNGIVKFTCPHITMKWPVHFTSTTVCKYINLREKCGLRSVTVVILIFHKKVQTTNNYFTLQWKLALV